MRHDPNLTDDDVRLIRALDDTRKANVEKVRQLNQQIKALRAESKNISRPKLAEKFDTTPGVIDNIVYFQTAAHVR